MKLSQTCINRPVFTSVIAFILILIGYISFLELPVRFSPYYFKPTLVVTTNVPGASPEYVEENITTPLEQSLAATPGLDLMMSRSMQGTSMIFLNFKNLSQQEFVTAQSQVLQEVDGTQLPPLNSRPQVMQNGDDNFIMYLAITDNNIPISELITYANNYIIPQLSQVSGVGEADVDNSGPALRITLDPQKMAALKISVNDVQNAINNSNTSVTLGNLYTDTQSLQLNAQMNVPDIPGFENLVIAKKNSRLIYLKDIATIAVTDQSLDPGYGYFNGVQGVGIEIDATDQANPIAVGQDIKALLQQIKPSLPEGMSIVPAFDLSDPLNQAVHEVYMTIFIAIILVILVTLAFLGNWRATLIPIVTIPVCLIAAFSIMFMLGFTVNVMTLLALVLAVGLVVDDAIVVLENTFRHIEMGETPLTAARNSISEISFAVLGITICLIAVYIPAAFLPNSIDTTYFQEFAFSLAGAIFFSGFLALTLSPMMCSRFLKPHSTKGYEEKLDRVMHKIHIHYEKALHWVLVHPKTIISILIANLALGITFFNLLPTDLLPKSPLPYIQGFLNGPNSGNWQYTGKVIEPFQQSLFNNPDLENVFVYNGAGNQGIFIMGKIKHGNPDKIVADLNAQLAKIPNVSGGISLMDANMNNGSSHQGSLFFFINGLASYQTIIDAANRLQKALQEDPKVAMALNDTQFNSQQYNLVVNRNLATVLGLDLSTLNNTLSTFLGGYIFPTTANYQVNGYGYPIIMQLPRDALKDLSILQQIYVENNAGQLIPASTVITASPSVDLAVRMHVNQLRAGDMEVNPNPGYSNGQLINDIQAKAAQILPEGLQIAWGGMGRNLIQNAASGNMFILLGLIFIYLVLAALFESFLDPLIILCTVPLCIVAGLIGLKLIGGSINIYTKIALVTLIGLVSKHGVLITQFANQLRSQGVEMREAVTKAALIRLRPILMTSLTMILGAIPLLLAFGTDSVGRAQIGIIIVLGLLFGSIFSLFVVPVAYLVIARFKKKYKY